MSRNLSSPSVDFPVRLIDYGIRFPVLDLSPLILSPSLVRERKGLIPMSRNLSSPSLMVSVAFLAKKVLASALLMRHLWDEYK
ncbi:unnamed protein product [Microthlaspi erraticum]|uniref:Uncharacterized protein n=1 Tax=Microthlaspi erraticum TaxID=1685480 RepID=A0A6D2KPZ2_9BRAS|nr:unnamed protein product [Microthlaspi erraticum]